MVMACVPDVVIGRPRNFAQSRMSASITASTIRPPLRDEKRLDHFRKVRDELRAYLKEFPKND